jgi:glycosyltransferase involved in cell wall biosynthesis
MVVHAYYPLGETRVQREADALVAAGYEVDVVCLRDDGEPARERIDGIQIHRLAVQIEKGSLGRQFLSYLRMLSLATMHVARLHHERPFSSVQIHNLPDFLVFAGVVPKLRGVPVILDLHDLMPEFFAGRFGDRHRAVGRAIDWQERISCGFADQVITVSDHWRRALIARGVPAESVSVVMNVADDSLFAPREPRPATDGLRLLYHGTVTRRYGLDLVLRAIERVRRDVPGVHLTIVGKGDDMASLRALRTSLRIEDHVDLRDELLPAEALPDLIARADLGVVPYRNDVFTDGLLPTKLMEYAAMQLPSIAARTTAIESHFAGTFVEFFEPGDAIGLADRIVDLSRRPERRAELAAGAERFTSRYNWNDTGAAYVALVDRLGRFERRLTTA